MCLRGAPHASRRRRRSGTSSAALLLCARGPASSFALELAQHSAGVHQVVVEDAASDGEQVADERITERVTHRKAFLPRLHDVLIPQHGELLRNDRLAERERRLELLDRAAAMDEDLEDADARRVRQRAEELRLERLQPAGVGGRESLRHA